MIQSASIIVLTLTNVIYFPKLRIFLTDYEEDFLAVIPDLAEIIAPGGKL